MTGTGENVWVWDPVEGPHFTHPSDIPEDDEVLARSKLLDKTGGPQSAKLSRAKQVEKKGDVALITRSDGSKHEIPKARILTWWEGLLLLQELEDTKSKPSWFTDELKTVLQEGAEKFPKKIVSSAFYTEKKLLDVAITGATVLDCDEKESHYRRENLRSDQKVPASRQGESLPGFWNISDIVGYMPPWEAFCNQRAGFYQDFYQVKWDHPFSETDYSNVENGCPGILGTTWEPDECLPPQLDALRIREKRKWVKRRQELESKLSSDKIEQAKRLRVEEAQKVAAKKPRTSRFKRDGQPLAQDTFRSKLGHDFKAEELDTKNVNVRTGWPRKPSEYPAGFSCAEPPGYCFATCDCMDDQRQQKPQEVTKAWLEDEIRNIHANAAIDALTAQTKFVRRRGQVTKICYFETQNITSGDQSHTKACLKLAAEVEQHMRSVLNDIPLPAISDTSAPVRIPANAFLKDAEDYEPLRYVSDVHAPWASVDLDDGQLLAVSGGPSSRPAQLKIELHNSDARAVIGACTVTDPTDQKPWTAATSLIARKFLDPQAHAITPNARLALQAQLEKVFNFETKNPKDLPLGQWLDITSTILRMLRSTAFANVVEKPGKP